MKINLWEDICYGTSIYYAEDDWSKRFISLISYPKGIGIKKDKVDKLKDLGFEVEIKERYRREK